MVALYVKILQDFYFTKVSNGISIIQNFQNGLHKNLNRMIENLSVEYYAKDGTT